MTVSPIADTQTYYRSPFVFDLRAVGIFRILLALIVLIDQFIQLGDWRAFHSAAGLLSAEDSRAWGNPWLWSLYWLSDGPLLPYFLEALRFFASVLLLLGIRSRLSAFVLFVLLASVATRNPLPLQGGDKVLIVMTFFGAFLPLGQRFSLSRLWFGPGSETTCRSAANVAFAIQVLLVWFMAGILKTGEPWWADGTAISMAVHLEMFATEFARLWRHWDWLLQPMTLFVFWLECLAPLLVLIPSYWSRLIGLLLLVALEVGIFVSLEVGLFPLISIVSLVPLAPPRAVDLCARWLSRNTPPAGSRLVLFFDRDCRFCVFACRFLLACCGMRGAVIREAQSDTTAAAILDDSFSWSVTNSRSTPTDGTTTDADDGYRQGWDAVLLVVESSPRRWIARILPGPESGARLYAWIGRRRGDIGAAGGWFFGRSNDRGWHGAIGRFMASAAIVTVLAWNIVSYPTLHQHSDLRPWVEPLIAGFNLRQYWSMFAPHPPSRDTWYVFPALARDGGELDLLSGRPVSTEPPVDGPGRYGGYRWRKAITRSHRLNELGRISGYFCRTGDWAAMDIWMFRRPNLGVAATADQPYEVVLFRRSRCTDTNDTLVKEFQANVDAMLAPNSAKAGQDG